MLIVIVLRSEVSHGRAIKRCGVSDEQSVGSRPCVDTGFEINTGSNPKPVLGRSASILFNDKRCSETFSYEGGL